MVGVQNIERFYSREGGHQRQGKIRKNFEEVDAHFLFVKLSSHNIGLLVSKRFLDDRYMSY